ncbi:MAG: YfhO family protein [Deltaproteobacteria bacterium]|nr:YfhO family protein [Deltaproteobacteria bacterium]
MTKASLDSPVTSPDDGQCYASRLINREWFGPALLTGLVGAVFWRVILLGEIFFLKDMQRWFYPSRLMYRARMLAGDFPLWAHQLGTGQQFAANPANSTFYPLNVLLLLPAPLCVSLFLVAHVWLATLASYGLLRYLALGRAGAAAGALAFGLGGYVLSMTWSGTYLLSVVWIPLVLWMGLRLARQRRVRDTGIFATCLATQVLTGEVQAVTFSGLFLLAFVLAESGTWRQRAVALLHIGGATVLGLLLALPQILPTLDLLESSMRAAGIDVTMASHWSFHPARLAELLVPELFGTPLRSESYLGYFMNNEGGVHRAPWMISPYFGSLSLLLVGFGLCRLPKRHRRWVVAALMVCLLGLALALGRHTPIFAAFLRTTPGANLFRYPAKFFALVALGMGLFAALGVDQLGQATEKARHRFNLAVMVAGGILLFSSAIAPWAVDKAVVTNALLREALLTLGVALGLWLVFRHRRDLVARALVAAVMLQISLSNIAIVPTIDQNLYAMPPPFLPEMSSRTPKHELPRVLVSPNLFRAGVPLSASNPQLQALQQKIALTSNTGVDFGFGYFFSYSATVTAVKSKLRAATKAMQRQTLDLFGIHFVLMSRRFQVQPWMRLELAALAEKMNLVLYRNQSARPYVYVADYVEGVRDVQQALARIRTPDIQRGRGAAIEGIDTPLAMGDAAGRCRLARAPGDLIEIDCKLAKPSWVVINCSYHPFWEASANGQSLALHRANGLVQAVRVPAGQTEVRLVYREPALSTAGPMALGALVVCLFFLFFGNRPWRKVVAPAT